MKRTNLIFAALLLVAGCAGEKDSETTGPPGSMDAPRFEECKLVDEPCIKDCELTEYYYAIWQRQFKKLNGMSEEYYNRHITVGRYFLHENSVGREWFHVDYRVTIGWAEICCNDGFNTKLDTSSSDYAYLNLRRGVNFNEGEIDFIVSKDVALASITRVNAIDSLPYPSLDAAVAAFRAKSGYPQLHPTQLTYRVPGRVPRIDGDPYLIGFGEIDITSNKCVKGHFNLRTGEASARTDACVVE